MSEIGNAPKPGITNGLGAKRQEHTGTPTVQSLIGTAGV
jgi:hypothetical protein